MVRFSAIGDCVMAVPVAASIRTRYPDAEITWAVEPWCAPVIDEKRLVTDLAIFERDKWEQHRWSPKTWKEQLSRYLALRKHNFDIGIDLQGQSKTALCLRIAKPAKRVALRGHDVISKNLNPVLGIPRNTQHAVEANLKALASLGDFPQEPRFIMPNLEAQKLEVRDLLPPRRIASIAVGAGKAKKLYPLELWEKVASQLIAKGFNVVFLGGARDPHPEVNQATDLIGNLTLAQSMAAIAMSDVHLAADTGTGHIAAAYNTPVVSIFGATPANVFRPYTKNGIVLDSAGSPANIQPEQAVSAVFRLLEGKNEAFSS